MICPYPQLILAIWSSVVTHGTEILLLVSIQKSTTALRWLSIPKCKVESKFQMLPGCRDWSAKSIVQSRKHVKVMANIVLLKMLSNNPRC